MNHKITAFPRLEEWGTQHFQQPPFSDIDGVASMRHLNGWPEVDQLVKLLNLPSKTMRFIEQVDDSRYYEQIIFEDKCVPTRACNWHDFYNACIWRLFPNTKRALNQIHMDEISQFGLTPRTPRRDRVTHFDECGMILAYSNSMVAEALSAHQWKEAFITHRMAWGKSVGAYVFGHANYEMMMHPHVGLTGKWLGVEVEDSFWDLPLIEQYQCLDAGVLDYAQGPDSFTRKQDLKPLPLLGIPGWWAENELPEFYDNTQYFRPKVK